MKKQKQIFSLAMLVLLTAFICSCNQEAEPSLYQVEDKGATPVITSIVPDKEALAGVTDVTINGSNFSSVKENNLVYFGTTKATVLQASPTQLVVKAPAKVANDLNTKVAVQGVENFSNIVKYNLLEAVGVYYAFAKGIEEPMTVAVDKNENVFVYLKDKGIKKIATDGKLTDWAPKGGESFFFDMKMGPNNIMYATRNLRLISQVEEGKASATFVTFPTGITIIALDFDADKNIWASGTGGNLYSVTPSKTITAFPIDYTVSAIRVYNGYVYVAGKNATEEAIYRYKINSNSSLANKEKYFDIGAKYGLNKIQVSAMAIGFDGELILGTDLVDAFVSVNNAGVSSSFYPGLISPAAKSFGWGTKRNLFYIREYIDAGATLHTLVRVDMQKTSAPNFGN